MPISACPTIPGRVSIFHSAQATYYAPSDHSGIGGMHQQRIRSTPHWRNGPARRDCVFVVKDQTIPGIRGLHVAKVILFFSFEFREKVYPAALVEWFLAAGDAPCDSTGMWIVKPDIDEDGFPTSDVIHTDCILRGAHLIGLYGELFIPRGFKHTDTLTTFEEFYVSKHADHHINEIIY